MLPSKPAAIESLLVIQKKAIDKAFSNNSVNKVFAADEKNNKKLTLEEYENLLRFSSNLILSRYTESNSAYFEEARFYGASQILLEEKVWASSINCPQVWSAAIKYIAYDEYHANALTPAGLFFLDSFVHQGLYGVWDLLALELKTNTESEIYFVENLSASKDSLEELGFKEIDKKLAIEKIYNKSQSFITKIPSSTPFSSVSVPLKIN